MLRGDAGLLGLGEEFLDALRGAFHEVEGTGGLPLVSALGAEEVVGKDFVAEVVEGVVEAEELAACGCPP